MHLLTINWTGIIIYYGNRNNCKKSRDIRFSQRCCWGLTLPGMWRFLFGRL